MKKYLLIILMIFGCMVSASAQKQARHSKKDMIKELHEFKLKFLAQEMDLKENQQQKFFEVYSKMSDEKHKLFKETRSLERKVENNGNATDAEYEAASAAILKAREKDAAIERKYDEQFSTFLSAKQIFKMKNAEEKFRRKMHEMRKNKRKK